MLFRGRQPEASIWRRFRTSADGFTFRRLPAGPRLLEVAVRAPVAPLRVVANGATYTTANGINDAGVIVGS